MLVNGCCSGEFDICGCRVQARTVCREDGKGDAITHCVGEHRLEEVLLVTWVSIASTRWGKS